MQLVQICNVFPESLRKRVIRLIGCAPTSYIYRICGRRARQLSHWLVRVAGYDDRAYSGVPRAEVLAALTMSMATICQGRITTETTHSARPRVHIPVGSYVVDGKPSHKSEVIPGQTYITPVWEWNRTIL